MLQIIPKHKWSNNWYGTAYIHTAIVPGCNIQRYYNFYIHTVLKIMPETRQDGQENNLKFYYLHPSLCFLGSARSNNHTCRDGGILKPVILKAITPHVKVI